MAVPNTLAYYDQTSICFIMIDLFPIQLTASGAATDPGALVQSPVTGGLRPGVNLKNFFLLSLTLWTNKLERFTLASLCSRV
jgi:hypothetical protein